jgi:tetratricopeptide (TPR) repeat protein
MLQVIREREPSKPSTKLSTADGLPTLAANRGTEPENLTELVRGELDWIVMKALEKDRARRYESAIDFAADVQRYLMDEPVLACPPSVGYRLRKFVRRNKGPVLAVSLVVVALLIGLIGTTWGLFWALEERDGKEQARQAAEVNEHKAETSATEARNAETDARIAEGKARKAETEARTAEGKARTAEAHERKAKELAQARLDQMEKASLLLATLLTDAAQSRSDAAAKPAKVFFAERLDYVMRQLDFETIDDPLILAKVQSTFGTCYWHLGFALKGIPLLEKAVKTRKDNLGPGHAETMESMINLAACYRVVKRPTASLPLYEDMLRVNKDKLGPDHAETLNSMDVLALGYMEAGRAPDAVKLVEEVARRRKPDDPRYFASREARAAVYQAAGRKAEALALREEAVQRYKDKFGPDHDMTLSGMAQLASSYKANGKFDEAVSMCESHLKLTRAKFGPDQSRSLFSMNDLASTLMAAGRTKDALPVLTDAVPRMRKNLGLQNIAMQDAVRNLIACHEKHDQYAQAEPLHRELTAHWKQQSGPNSTAYANRLVFLGRNLLKQSKPALAEPVLRECVTIRTKYGPNLWTTFEAKSLLGAALLDQKKYTDAEPFLLGAYRSMKDGEAKTPGKIVSVSTLERLIRLYEAVGDADKAAKWRKELEDTNKRNKEKIGSNPL